jgi:apoptosis-inducing factor 2
MTRTILILGASYGGVTVAQKLLKRTRPKIPDFHVVLVNPSTHFYWNIASIRSIVPGQLRSEELLENIPQSFNYSPDAFKFILGSAESVNIKDNVVHINTAGGVVTQIYDFLIIATSSRTIGKVPWKAEGTYEQIRDLLDETRQKVEQARSIIIAGGGPTGVELAGELGFEFLDRKDIKLVSPRRDFVNTQESSDYLSLPHSPPYVAKTFLPQISTILS